MLCIYIFMIILNTIKNNIIYGIIENSAKRVRIMFGLFSQINNISLVKTDYEIPFEKRYPELISNKSLSLYWIRHESKYDTQAYRVVFSFTSDMNKKYVSFNTTCIIHRSFP